MTVRVRTNVEGSRRILDTAAQASIWFEPPAFGSEALWVVISLINGHEHHYRVNVDDLLSALGDVVGVDPDEE